LSIQFGRRRYKLPLLEKIKLFIKYRILKKLFRQPFINILLFILTIFTTRLAQNIWYSIAVISILFTHEMGHYLMCRKYRIKSTLPFFIPIPPPLNPFGTMGAVIKMEGKIPHRKALFDVGVAGPLAGLVVTIVTLIIGLNLSMPTQAIEVGLGRSLLFTWFIKWFNPALLDNPEAFPNPVIFAGWVGLFITALNLLPIGQLDGGHIVYSLFGSKSKYVYRMAITGFAINTAYYPPWIIFLILLITFGLRHPPPSNDSEPLDLKRWIIGIFTFIVFIVAFMPFPFQIY